MRQHIEVLSAVLILLAVSFLLLRVTADRAPEAPSDDVMTAKIEDVIIEDSETGVTVRMETVDHGMLTSEADVSDVRQTAKLTSLSPGDIITYQKGDNIRVLTVSRYQIHKK